MTNLDQSIELYRTVFGARLERRSASEPDGLAAALLDLNGVEIELLAPTREDSPVGKFLERRGPGLHHIAFAVADLEAQLEAARAAGLELIDEVPRIGMHGARIAFVHPKSVGGVLTEFVEA